MNRRTSRILLMLLIAGVLSAFAALMAIYPSAALSSAVRGLSIWWDVLFPSCSLFSSYPKRCSASASCILSVRCSILSCARCSASRASRLRRRHGLCVSGYPVGAKLTTRLRADRLVTPEEGERLIAFTSTSDPIFLIGAVAVGFFRQCRPRPHPGGRPLWRRAHHRHPNALPCARVADDPFAR